MNFHGHNKKQGFTLIELLVVIAIVATLATLVITGVQTAQNKAYTARTLTEFRSFRQAMELYLLNNSDYPADVSRNIPAGLEGYLSTGDWPDGPYPSSVYDWDNIPAHGYIQISLRFCDIDGDNCRFPIEEWANDFDHQSSMYWCFEGPCRSHPSRPESHPGYCVNC